MDEMLSEVAPDPQTQATAPESAPRRNKGWFAKADPRVNRQGRPKGRKAPPEVHPGDCARKADRLRRLVVEPRWLRCWLTSMNGPCYAGLPKGFEVVSGRVGEDGSLVLVVRADEFDRVARGCLIPTIDPMKIGLKFL